MTRGGSAFGSSAAVAAMGLVALAAWWRGTAPMPARRHALRPRSYPGGGEHDYADVIGNPAMRISTASRRNTAWHPVLTPTRTRPSATTSC